MISTVGRAYLTSNIENDEYSYPKAFSAASLTFAPIQNSAGRRFEKLDIRFVKDNISVLIETKQNFTAADEEQLSAYVEYEKALTGNKIIAILANTINDNVKVWRGVISDGDLMSKETALRTMDEYVDFYTSKINDKEMLLPLAIRQQPAFIRARTSYAEIIWLFVVLIGLICIQHCLSFQYLSRKNINTAMAELSKWN